MKIFKRKTAPKYSEEDQERRAQLLKPDVQLLMDDEKYFVFTGDIASNRSYFTVDRATAPNHIKFKCQAKFEPKLLVWMAI
jgi:hypothetical protein